MADGSQTLQLGSSNDARAHIERVVATQHSYFAAGHTLPRAFREEQLRALEGALKRNDARILEALRADLSRPEIEAYAVDVGYLLGEARKTIGHLRKWMRPRRSLAPLVAAPSYTKTVRDPLGVTLIIAPWNYPFQLCFGPLIGALAAGNTAVIKPSELAPASSSLIAEMVAATFDPAVVAAVEGDVRVSQALLDQPWAHIFFTGSPKIGRIVAKVAAEQLCKVTLELGGKNPTVVMPSANIDVAARRILFPKFFNAGQTCIAPDYVLVHRTVYEQLLKSMANVVRDFFGPQPKDTPDFGRIINTAHAQRLSTLIDRDKLVCGGDVDIEQRYVAPTIMRDNHLNDACMQDEIFGPILATMPIDSWDDVRKMVAAHSNPLAFYLFSSDSDDVRNMEQIPFGTGCVNNVAHQFMDEDIAFGGVGTSGLGSYHGRHSFDAFSREKGILHTGTFLDVPLKYPPYQGKLRFMRKLVR